MIFKRIKQKAPARAVESVQTGRAGQPFTELDRYVPLGGPQLKLYDALREAVPLIDAAIFRLIRLTGGFHPVCGDAAAQRGLERFLRAVPVGGSQTGIDAFLSTYFEQLLTYGTAVGELVRGASGGIAALYNAPLDGIELRRGDSPLDVQVCTRGPTGEARPVPHPELVVLSVLNPAPGALGGTSLLRGLPFVSGVLLKIFHAVGRNWERVGNVRFAVTCRPGSDPVERAYTQERAAQVAREWGEAMRADGPVKDFVAVGDVDIRVIGADNQILDSETPVRQILEQIVAKTGLPPFLLGLHWSATERMSAQQADLLTSELEAYRRILTPALEKICRTWLRLEGFAPQVEIVWDDVTLLDEVEQARARLYTAQAKQLEAGLPGPKEGANP